MCNAGIQMSWEGYTWILLRAIGVSSSDLTNVLQPVQGQFPSTEADFDAMCMTLRRMGHIRENAPHNLAHALRSNDRGNAMFVEPDGMAFPITQTGHDPWATADPWGGSSATFPTQTAPQQQQPAMQGGSWGNYNQPQAAPPQAFPTQNDWQDWNQPIPQEEAAASEADTDSNTESSYGEETNYNTPDFAGLAHPQTSEKLWWGMARSNSMGENI